MRRPAVGAGLIGLAVALTALTGCGGAAAISSAPSPCPPGGLSAMLLRLDDLPAAGFTAVAAPQRVDVGELVGGDAAAVAALRADGLTAAALAHYFRQGVALDTANGPVDVIVDAAAFGDVAGASKAYEQTVARRDGAAGVTPVSTGSIGDSAHGDITLSTPVGGTPLVQYTITFRTGTVLNSVTTRGRQAGTGIADAVVLALRQSTRHCGTAA